MNIDNILRNCITKQHLLFDQLLDVFVIAPIKPISNCGKLNKI